MAMIKRLGCMLLNKEYFFTESSSLKKLFELCVKRVSDSMRLEKGKKLDSSTIL